MSNVTCATETVATLENGIEVRKSTWTGTVYIKGGFGRTPGYGTRSRITWQIWIGGEFSRSFGKKQMAVQAAKREAARRAA